MPKEATKQPTKTAELRDTKNGITRPTAKTTTGKVWAIADKLSAKAKEAAPRKMVLAETGKQGINPATAATQYGRWRKYHGLVGTGKEK